MLIYQHRDIIYFYHNAAASYYSTIAMLEDIGSSKNSQQVFIFGTLTFSLPWPSPQRHSSTLYRNMQTCMFTCSNIALNCLRHFIYMCLAYIIDEKKNDLHTKMSLNGSCSKTHVRWVLIGSYKWMKLVIDV